MPHTPDHDAPGSSHTTSSLDRGASGGHVIGSTGRLPRRSPSGSVSPVRTCDHENRSSPHTVGLRPPLRALSSFLLPGPLDDLMDP